MVLINIFEKKNQWIPFKLSTEIHYRIKEKCVKVHYCVLYCIVSPWKDIGHCTKHYTLSNKNNNLSLGPERYTQKQKLKISVINKKIWSQRDCRGLVICQRQRINQNMLNKSLQPLERRVTLPTVSVMLVSVRGL